MNSSTTHHKSHNQTKKLGSLHWAHWLIIVLSLLLTLFAWYISQQNVNDKREALFQREATQVIHLVQERMAHYEDALLAAVATIQANGGHISYHDWKTYVSSLDLLEKYPGINGLGTIRYLQRNQIANYLTQQRIDRPNFSIHPNHNRHIVIPITYIIPVKGNEKAVGLDMAHEINRYTAAIKAMRTGLAQITRPITLVQDQEKTPGFLLYAPYYKGDNDQTEAKRIQNFEGMVYAPFIFKKLMSGVLEKQQRHVAIKISDQQNVLYNEHYSTDTHFDANTNFKLNKSIPMYGQQWNFEIWGSQSFNNAISGTQPLSILVGGIVIDTLLLALFISISRSNQRAMNMVHKLTIDLRKKTQHLTDANTTLLATQNKLEKLAHYDLLTELPNRHSFIATLNATIARAKQNNSLFAVCFMDLDNFKQVNDSLGHHTGDQLLCKVANNLSRCLRDVDYLARLSGDEFGIIIDNIQFVDHIAGVLEHYLKQFKSSYQLDQFEIHTTTSIGVAVFPSAGDDAETLIKHADIAMYKAKEHAGNTYAFFNESTNQKVIRRHSIELALHHAVERDELSLVYQPLIDANTSNLFGVEALIRWQSEQLGTVSPAEFIPIAEDCGVIHTIGSWVIDQVLRDFKQLRQLNDEISVSINTSIRQLEDPEFAQVLIGHLNQQTINTEKIILEVTETAIMQHSKHIIESMSSLSESGVQFALDDFGTGYSSMDYLKLLPINYIKIDQSFVSDLEQNESSTAIVKAIIHLSHALNIKTIAEGIETSIENKFLIDEKCEYLQGYFHSKPLSLIKLLEQFYKQKP